MNDDGHISVAEFKDWESLMKNCQDLQQVRDTRTKSGIEYCNLNNDHLSQWDTEAFLHKGDKDGNNMLDKHEHHDVVDKLAAGKS